MITENWDLNLAIRVNADRDEDASFLLRQIAGRVKRGEKNGDGNYCAGTYEFMTEPRPSRLLDQLRAYEQQVSWQQETITELRERVERLTAANEVYQQKVIDMLARVEHEARQYIVERDRLTAERDSLKRERTAVRRALRHWFWPFDDNDQRSIEDRDALYLDQGVQLAMDKIDELTAELDSSHIFAEVWKRKAEQYQNSEGVSDGLLATFIKERNHWWEVAERLTAELEKEREGLTREEMETLLRLTNQGAQQFAAERDELKRELEQARTWAKAWKMGAHRNRRGWHSLYLRTVYADKLLNDRYQQLQPAGAAAGEVGKEEE